MTITSSIISFKPISGVLPESITSTFCPPGLSVSTIPYEATFSVNFNNILSATSTIALWNKAIYTTPTELANTGLIDFGLLVPQIQNIPIYEIQSLYTTSLSNKPIQLYRWDAFAGASSLVHYTSSNNNSFKSEDYINQIKKLRLSFGQRRSDIGNTATTYDAGYFLLPANGAGTIIWSIKYIGYCSWDGV